MSLRSSLFAGAALLLCAVPVLAGELRDFVAARDGASACWGRVYDTDHLAKHPDQQVKAMSLTVTFMKETEFADAQYAFRLEAELRGGIAGEQSGVCSNQDGQVFCGVDCDGGGVYVSRRGDGNVLIDLETIGSIWMVTACGEDDGEQEGFMLKSGVDDKEFLLSPLPAKACKPVVW
jgi:hypothetical protein